MTEREIIVHLDGYQETARFEGHLSAEPDGDGGLRIIRTSSVGDRSIAALFAPSQWRWYEIKEKE